MACKISKQNILDHFADVSKMVEIGSCATNEINYIMLTRYACLEKKQLLLLKPILQYKLEKLS